MVFAGLVCLKMDGRAARPKYNQCESLGMSLRPLDEKEIELARVRGNAESADAVLSVCPVVEVDEGCLKLLFKTERGGTRQMSSKEVADLFGGVAIHKNNPGSPRRKDRACRRIWARQLLPRQFILIGNVAT